MDFSKLERSIQAAESVKCVQDQYSGIPLGTLMRAWPEEVPSGRVHSGRGTKSAASKIVKQYVKLVQVSAELSSLIEQHKDVLAVDAVGRFSDIPAAATAVAPDAAVPLVIHKQPDEGAYTALNQTASVARIVSPLDLLAWLCPCRIGSPYHHVGFAPCV